MLQDGDQQYDTIISNSEGAVECFINTNGGINNGPVNNKLSKWSFVCLFLSLFSFYIYIFA